MVEATRHAAAISSSTDHQGTSTPSSGCANGRDSGASTPSTATASVEDHQSTGTPPVSAIRTNSPSAVVSHGSRRKTVSSGSLGAADGAAVAAQAAESRSPGRSSSLPAPHPSSPPSSSPLHLSHTHHHYHAAQHWPQGGIPVVLNPLAQSIIALEDSSSYSECEEYPTPERIQLQHRLRRSSSITTNSSGSTPVLASANNNNNNSGSGGTSSPVMTTIGGIGGAMHGSSPIKKLYASAASVETVDAGAKGDDNEGEEGDVSS